MAMTPLTQASWPSLVCSKSNTTSDMGTAPTPSVATSGKRCPPRHDQIRMDAADDNCLDLHFDRFVQRGAINGAAHQNVTLTAHIDHVHRQRLSGRFHRHLHDARRFSAQAPRSLDETAFSFDYGAEVGDEAHDLASQISRDLDGNRRGLDNHTAALQGSDRALTRSPAGAPRQAKEALPTGDHLAGPDRLSDLFA